MPNGKKHKRHKMATHKRKKRLRKNRHKKKKGSTFVLTDRLQLKGLGALLALTIY